MLWNSVCMSLFALHADSCIWIVGIDQTVAASCQQFHLNVFNYDSVWVKWLWKARPALLWITKSSKAVCCWRTSVVLADGKQIDMVCFKFSTSCYDLIQTCGSATRSGAASMLLLSGSIMEMATSGECLTSGLQSVHCTNKQDSVRVDFHDGATRKPIATRSSPKNAFKNSTIQWYKNQSAIVELPIRIELHLAEICTFWTD